MSPPLFFLKGGFLPQALALGGLSGFAAPARNQYDLRSATNGRSRQYPVQSLKMKTFSARAETTDQGWYLIDATNVILGRLAASLAHRLRGKHKPEFTPHVDTGDFIVVVNADKIRVTGNKAEQKKYYRHCICAGKWCRRWTCCTPVFLLLHIFSFFPLCHIRC